VKKGKGPNRAWGVWKGKGGERGVMRLEYQLLFSYRKRLYTRTARNLKSHVFRGLEISEGGRKHPEVKDRPKTWKKGKA